MTPTIREHARRGTRGVRRHVRRLTVALARADYQLANDQYQDAAQRLLVASAATDRAPERLVHRVAVTSRRLASARDALDQAYIRSQE